MTETEAATIADRLANIRVSSSQLLGILVVCIGLSLSALVLTVWLASTRASVARAEAHRAVQQSVENRARADAADCALLDLLRSHPGDPEPETNRGRQLVARAQAAYVARGCP